MRRISTILIFAVTGLPSPARADLISRDAAQFFASSTVMELVRVDRVQGNRIQATTLRVLRAPTGAPHSALQSVSPIPRGPTPKKVRTLIVGPGIAPRVSEQLLHACGESMCTWGRDMGDYFAVYPASYTPAELRPGMVEKRSLELLARGKPAPKICLALTLRFVDEPKHTERMGAAVDAGDGQGRAQEPGKNLRRASFLLQAGRTMLVVGDTPDRQVVFTGPLPGVGSCHAVDLRPTWPPVRTRGSLRRALTGTLSQVVLARGTIDIRRRGTPLERRLYPLTVEHDLRQGTRFSCRLFRDHAPHQNHSRLASKMLSFPTADVRDKYIGLVGGFPRGADLLRFAEAVKVGASVTWPVRLHGVNDEGAVVGQVTLTHVPDPD